MTRPDTREQEAIVAEDGAGFRAGSELERVVLQEVRRVGRSVETLGARMDEKFEQLGDQVHKSEVESAVLKSKLETAQAEIAALKTIQATQAAQIATLSTAQAVTGTKLAGIIAAAGIVAGLLDQGIHLLRGH
jgi:hypothetical protein